MRAAGVCRWGKGSEESWVSSVFQPCQPCVQSMGRVGLKDIPAFPCAGHRPQPDQPRLGQLRVWLPSPARWGRGFGVPSLRWPPLVLCMDVRSAEVKHIPVLNVTKNNLELSKLEWCEPSYKCNPWGQLGFLSILKCYWSITFPNQFFTYTTGIIWSELLHIAILEKHFLNHCHFGLFHPSFVTLKLSGM